MYREYFTIPFWKKKKKKNVGRAHTSFKFQKSLSTYFGLRRKKTSPGLDFG